jgi:hypothetical protein
MKRWMMSVAVVAIATFALGLAGCGSDTGGGKSQGGKSTGAGGKQGAESDEMKAVQAELAKLSEEDRASAEKQKVCPVSENLLGSMPGMKKVEVEGREVWLCCGGCESTLREDPEKYLAKIEEK